MAFIATTEHLPIIRHKSIRRNPPGPPVDPVVIPRVEPETSTHCNYIWYHTMGGITHHHYVNVCHTESRAVGNLVTGHGGNNRTRRATGRESTGLRHNPIQEMGRMV